MALMTKIRDNMTTAFAVFAGLFIIYVVLDWGLDITGQQSGQRQRNIVGSVNDIEITYEDFSERLRQALEQQKQQNKDVELDEQMVNSIRDQLWDNFINQELLKQETERLGIVVTDEEIRDWVFGENPPQFLTTQFTDSAGNFNRDNYVAALRDPRNKNLIIQVETSLKQMRLQEKVQSALMAMLMVSESEVEQKYLDQNIKYDAEYALFDPNVFIKDTVSVSESDMQQYYQEHVDEFQQEHTRKFSYVVFKEEPSKEDSDAVLRDFDGLKKKALAGEDFLELLKQYSDVPLSDAFFKHGEISKVREDAAFGANAGDILGPIKDYDGYHLLKVLEFQNDTSDYVKASHILFKIGDDSVETKKTAQDVLQRAKKGEDFAELAKKYSTDRTSVDGGDLGWFGKGRMVKPFEDAAFKAKTGDVVGPVRSQFGIHIIKVTGHDNRSVKIADIVMSAKASSTTRNALMEKAKTLQELAKEIGVDSAAKTMNLEVKKTAMFTNKSNFIPGIGQEGRLVRFAFENELKTVSDVIYTQQGYGVFEVAEINLEGAKPFKDVENIIKPRVQRLKKMQQLRPRVEQWRAQLANGESLEKLRALDPLINVTQASSFTLGGSVTGIGRDLFFIGAVSKMNAGEISPIIENPLRGMFIIRLLSKTPFDTAAYAQQKPALHKQLYETKRNKFMGEWMQNLKKEATIVDNRDLFFR